MVEDRITDGKRIAQLLASELTGLATPPLDRVSVVDADPDAEPSPDGTEAYGVAVDDDQIGTVTTYPDRAVLTIDDAVLADVPDDLADEATDEGGRVVVESGAAVKRAVDLLAASLEE